MFEWNPYLLCGISLITGFMIHFSRGLYSKTRPDNPLNLWGFNLYQNLFSLITVFLIFLLSDRLCGFSFFSVVLGSLMGVANTFTLYASLRAYRVGPFSYTTVVVSLSVIIPTLSGLFYGEKISLIQYVGLVLMILCLALSPESKSDGKKASTEWFLWTMVATISSGMVGIFQKVHQGSEVHRSEMAVFLISCFISSIIICVIFYCIESVNLHKKIVLHRLDFLQVLGGFSNAASHSIIIYLVGVLPAIVIFPIVNLIPMLLLILSSLLIFKERLSLRRWIGVLIGLVSAFLLSGVLSF